MKPEFSGIERRLDELNERLARLEALKAKSRSEFDADPYLRDIAERNLEVAAQCCLDICHRIISIENALVIFQVEGETDFNRWNKETSLRNREKGQQISYVRVRRWRKHSAIEEVSFISAGG